MSDSPTSELESVFVCDCEEWTRSACSGEPFYKEHEGKRYCVLHFPGKEKSADFQRAFQRKLDSKDFNFRGLWFPNDLKFSEFNFGGAADFSSATFSGAADFGGATFSANAHFSHATFSGVAVFRAVKFAFVSFNSANFSADADFRDAGFSAEADFNKASFVADAYFVSATFSSTADFSAATFQAGVDYSYASFLSLSEFRTADFMSTAQFRHVNFNATARFSLATFRANASFTDALFYSNVDFSASSFRQEGAFNRTSFRSEVRFTQAIFGNYMSFSEIVFAKESSLNLEYVKVEHPEHISFQTVSLRPIWFINVDARKFNFINVRWLVDIKGDESAVRGQSLPYRLLAITYRQLAINAEKSNRLEEASRFRYWAIDARRKTTWHGLAFWKLGWWYWLTSGYGERPGRALAWLFYIWLLFGLLYTQVGFARWKPTPANASDAITVEFDKVGAPLNFGRALTYSLSVMSFQKPDDPHPSTNTAQMLVILEAILSTLQVGRVAAALALAARRERLD